ncbi:MAG: hypothetical protein CVT99_00960 [Bacteroidetes bacterium HGW-Bacteroidetes-16]|jgi:hypothetical protein|nr:MAG: hypothetical protein CVT99_00960 [Bacteroidetes bacterium HGW-Bacteroidetes-16]
MLFKNLSFEKFKADVYTFSISENESYIDSYAHFIQYFAALPEIKKHHLIIASHFVYGWMPTVLHLNTKDIDKVLVLLNKAKKGHLINEDELQVLKMCVNNSIVGASKLLHFINPAIYAIFDSRVYRYLTNNKSSYGIDKPATYLAYLKTLLSISEHEAFAEIHALIESHFKSKLTPNRAIELVMFETDRREHQPFKEN